MKHLIATAALASLVASPAFAQNYQYNPDEGPYLGAGMGYSETDFDIGGYYRDRGYPNTNTDTSDTGYKLFVGYQFNPNFAIEAGYANFGEFSANENGGSGKAELSVEGFTAALVGKLPIQNGFSVFGKLGMVAWDADLNESDNTGSASYGEDGSDPYYGIGAEYEVERIIMRAEYERYEISDSGEDFEVDLISASIGYRF